MDDEYFVSLKPMGDKEKWKYIRKVIFGPDNISLVFSQTANEYQVRVNGFVLRSFSDLDDDVVNYYENTLLEVCDYYLSDLHSHMYIVPDDEKMMS